MRVLKMLDIIGLFNMRKIRIELHDNLVGKVAYGRCRMLATLDACIDCAKKNNLTVEELRDTMLELDTIENDLD